MSDSGAPVAAMVASGDASLAGLGKRSALGFLGAFASGISTIVTIVIASRALDEQGTGSYFVAVAMFSIAQGLTTLGLDAGLQFFVPAIDLPSARRWIRRATLLSLLAGALVAMVVWWQAEGLATLLVKGESTGAEAEVARVLRSVAVLLPIAGCYEVVMSGLRSTDRVGWAVILDRLARPAAQVGAMAGVASVKGSPDAMFRAWALPFAVAAIAAIAAARWAPSPEGSTAATGDVGAGEFWRYTGPRAAARFAQVVTQRVDVLLLAALATVEDAGVYGTVSRCMIAGVFVATAVQQVVQPRLRRQVLAGKVDAVRATYATSTTWLVLATWPAYLLMAAFAPVLLGYFGGDTARGATALAILSVTMLVASGCGLVDVVLLMLGRSMLSTAFVIAALVTNLTLNAALIPPLGMNGAAIAWSVSILITNLGPLAAVAKRGLHPWGRPLRTAATVAVGAVLIPALAVRWLFGANSGALLVAIVLGTLLLSTAAFIQRRTLLLNDLVSDARGRGTPRST